MRDRRHDMRWTGLRIPGSFANELGRINLLKRDARFASNSAVKHLFTRTSTTADLYTVPNTGHSLPELRDGALAKLVKAGNYGAADQVRLHLIQEEKEITHHPIYEQAAMWGLPWTIGDEQRLTHLETCFSLIHRRHPTLQPLFETGADNLPVTRRFSKFASPSDRFSAILRLGIICATKGYVQPIVKDTLHLIVRFAPEDIGTAWLRDMESL
ncbi:hypothetical protein C0991_007060 [Blastosporella zonata]|nr:hypothetical protein C0991_007060 [Blastosporella zonata]